MWYPTPTEEGTTVEEVAEGYMEGAEMMGAMMAIAAGYQPLVTS